jgi:hypothetical protein
MKKEKFIIFNKDNKITIRRWNSILIMPIPLVKTIGLLYHKFINGHRIRILFKRLTTHEFSLILLLTTSDVYLKEVYETIDYFIDFAKKSGADEISAIVVNKRLNRKILERYGWKFYKKNWYIGNHYKLKI